tara:strand:- start:2146 stop:3099 length:954 start_codon:yes stop_codon:yes gene_type:complete
MAFRVLPLYLYAFIGLLVALPSASQSQEPIKIITNNWTSQVVLSEITGHIFQSMGSSVEYLPSSISDQWGALAHGAAHVQIEIWEGTMSDQFNRLVADGKIIDAGSHYATTREDWWYPKYVEELCPGLPDWKALKACTAIFKRPSSRGEGVYFAAPWEKPDEARIRALGLNFQVRTLPNGDALWAELTKSYAAKQPIVLFNWTPNWVESRYEGAFVEFPKHSAACETDPSWGINKQFVYDCGNPRDGWLKKAATVSFKQDYECAFSTLKSIRFNNQQIASIAALVDVEKMSFQAAAEQWLNSNTSLWQSWIPQECKQ